MSRAIKTHKTYLKSEIPVITEEMPGLASSTIGIWVKTGSRNEAPSTRGISHFIEHMLFKGTDKRSPLDIAKEIESVGGTLNAFTGKEYTCYYAKVLNKDIPKAIDLLSDIFINSKFDTNELEKECGVVLQEIKMVNDTPDDLVHDVFSAALWKGHALGSPVLGTEKTVSSFTRDMVLDYYNERYQPENIFISAAGGFSRKRIESLVAKSFGRLRNHSKQKPVSAPEAESRGSVKFIKRPLEQVHFCLGTPTVSQSHRDRYKLYLLSTMLGGGMSSRLFQEIREKRGLAYSVYSYLNLMKDIGAFVVYAGTTRKEFKLVTELIVKEFAKMRKGPGRDELLNAKAQLKGGMLLGLESSDSRMMKLARDEIYFGKPITVREIVKGIDAVKPAQIKALASKLLRPSKMTVVAIGKATKASLPSALK
jgi:predicted Zn-dependent peptidase